MMSTSTGATSFRKYCESTSLHGWQYIYYSSQKGWRLMWIGMTLSSVIIAFCFVFKQTSEFTKATVVTTVDTTTAPLSDVYFPAVTICNINQVTNIHTDVFSVTNDYGRFSFYFEFSPKCRKWVPLISDLWRILCHKSRFRLINAPKMVLFYLNWFLFKIYKRTNMRPFQTIFNHCASCTAQSRHLYLRQ